MQRRRPTPQQNSSSSSTTSNGIGSSFVEPSWDPVSRSNSHKSSASNSHGRGYSFGSRAHNVAAPPSSSSFPPPLGSLAPSPYDYTPPSHPSAGIELRDRPSHAISSSISHAFHRTADADADAAYSNNYANRFSRSPYPPPSYTVSPLAYELAIMKPIVSAVQAWSCVVISTFAILILSIMGLLFKNNHHEMVGGIDDPSDGPAVAATIFVAVLIYAGFLVFCGLQGLLHLRENRRGAIAL